MKVVGQMTDYRVTVDRPTRSVYGMDGPLGQSMTTQRRIFEVTILADELDLNGPMNSDPKWMNVILHPGTACSWTASQGYVVNDQRGRRAGNVEQLEKERDTYRREMDSMKDELARVKKECEILKRTMGLRAERVMEAVKKGANPRMLNLDVDGDE